MIKKLYSSAALMLALVAPAHADVRMIPYEGGVILKSLNEVYDALRLIESGKVKPYNGDSETRKVLNGRTEAATPLAMLAAAGKSSFAEQVIQNIPERLKKFGKFHSGFEYDALGTPYFKSRIDLQPSGNSFIFSFSSASVREVELSAALKRPRALVSIKIEKDLTPNAGGELQINLPRVFKNVQTDILPLAFAATPSSSSFSCQTVVLGHPNGADLTLPSGARLQLTTSVMHEEDGSMLVVRIERRNGFENPFVTYADRSAVQALAKKIVRNLRRM